MKAVKAVLALIFVLALAACGNNLSQEARLQKVQALVDKGKYESAEKEIRKLVPDMPTDSVLLYLGAKTYFELGLPDTAVSYARKLTSLYPKHTAGLELMYEAAGKIEDFETQLWAVSQLGYFAHDRRRYYSEIAELNFKLENYGMAIQTCNTILDYDPDNIRVMFILGSALASAGELDSALKVFQRIDRLHPGNIEVMANLGSFLASAKKYDEAEVVFRRMVRQDTTFLGGWMGLGNVLMSKADTNGAIEAYRRVFERDSTYLQVDSLLRVIDSSRSAATTRQ